jgi:hypothetical protein
LQDVKSSRLEKGLGKQRHRQRHRHRPVSARALPAISISPRRHTLRCALICRCLCPALICRCVCPLFSTPHVPDLL